MGLAERGGSPHPAASPTAITASATSVASASPAAASKDVRWIDEDHQNCAQGELRKRAHHDVYPGKRREFSKMLKGFTYQALVACAPR